MRDASDVVIGAASGMGAAVARRLAAEGRRLVLADLDTDAATAVADGLPGDVAVQRCDLGSPADLAALARVTGPVARLVLTAGLSPSMSPGRRLYEIDLIGPAHLLDTFLPSVGEGTVAVLLASMAAHFAPADDAIDAVLDQPSAPSFFDDLAAVGVDIDQPDLAYVHSKRGLVRLVRREAKAWGERGARLVSVSPGIVDTPMGRREDEAQPVMADMIATSPLGRRIEADEVAAVIEFLLSDAASAVTGTDVLVDGGVVAAFTS